jgi:GNAT superfamily N-acetyltransferase
MNIEIRSVGPQLLEDYLDFFDNTAFTDNHEWAGCYCCFYLIDHTREDWDTRTAEQNRRSVTDLIAGGDMHGYLAYVEGKVAGWCHAGPKTCFPALMESEELLDADLARTGSIVCFNVDPAQRRRGISAALLAAACEGFVALGLEVVEAYPRPEASGDSANYHGPLRMYLQSGFVTHRQFPTYQVVRKALGEGEQERV